MAHQHVRRRRQAPADQPTAIDPPPDSDSSESGTSEANREEQEMIQLLPAMLLLSAIVSSLFSPIGDCDEVYNYWEPTHYLLYGSGMQTWEYSPAYGLRSYLYVGLHALFGYLYNPYTEYWLPHKYRMKMFFFIRQMLGVAHALAMIRFVRAIRNKMGYVVASFTTLIASVSPGLFQASISYLPQSFSMFAVTIAFGCFIDGSGPFGCIFWMGIAGLIGWPFVGLLAICLAYPLVHRFGWLPCIKAAMLTVFICLVPSLLVDYYYYKKWMLAVLNIVKYNVFTSHGADLYGVEPWHYYFRNLFLNFNIAWLAYLLVLPISAAILLLNNGNSDMLFGKKNVNNAELISLSKRAIGYLWPSVVFLFVFLLMAHKEERFLYPIYPLIAFGAATAFYLIAKSGIFPFSSRQICSVLLLSSVALSFSRTWAIISNYNAPVVVYSAIPPGKASVCVGKEWHRFPSSFFLPSPDSELLYLKSGFSGLLPRPFSREENGTWIVPPGMNDLNQEELDRYSDISKCDFIVDLDLPDQQEPHYDQLQEFSIAYKIRFLDASRTPWICRAFHIPFFSEKCVIDGTYFLLKRIRD